MSWREGGVHEVYDTADKHSASRITQIKRPANSTDKESFMKISLSATVYTLSWVQRRNWERPACRKVTSRFDPCAYGPSLGILLTAISRLGTKYRSRLNASPLPVFPCFLSLADKTGPTRFENLKTPIEHVSRAGSLYHYRSRAADVNSGRRCQRDDRP